MSSPRDPDLEPQLRFQRPRGRWMVVTSSDQNDKEVGGLDPGSNSPDMTRHPHVKVAGASPGHRLETGYTGLCQGRIRFCRQNYIRTEIIIFRTVPHSLCCCHMCRYVQVALHPRLLGFSIIAPIIQINPGFEGRLCTSPRYHVGAGRRDFYWSSEPKLNPMITRTRGSPCRYQGDKIATSER